VRKLEKEIPERYMIKDWKKGDYFYSVEKYEEALFFYNKAMEGTTTTTPFKGVDWDSEKNGWTSIEKMPPVTSQNKDDYGLISSKARTLFHLDRFEEAIEYHDKNLIKYPDNRSFWKDDLGKGNALVALGRFDEAKKCYKAALRAPGYCHPLILKKLNDISEINHDADSSNDFVKKKYH